MLKTFSWIVCDINGKPAVRGNVKGVRIQSHPSSANTVQVIGENDCVNGVFFLAPGECVLSQESIVPDTPSVTQ